MKFLWVFLLHRFVSSVNLAPCDQNVVGQVFSEGFFQFAVMNCVVDNPATGQSITGLTPVDPAACLALFITKYKDVGPYPVNSGLSCGVELQGFVSRILNIRPSLAGFSFNFGTGKVDFNFNYLTWSATYGPKFLSFASTSGATMGSSLCTGYQVRDLAKANTMALLVKQAAGGAVFGWPASSTNDFCIICYAQFLQYLATNFVASEAVLCNVADPSSNSCYSTQAVSSALIWFNTCAGFPITFTGPLCSTAYVSKIESYMPYYTITSCQINSDPSMCRLMNELLAHIQSNSDITCTQCYIEFVQGLKNLMASTTRVKEACSGSWDSVWSTECIQVLTDLLSTFSICSGLPMDTSNKIPNLTSILAAAQSMIK